jgi:hypothetical protein
MTSRRIGCLGLAVIAVTLGACSSSKSSSSPTTTTSTSTTVTTGSNGSTSTTSSGSLPSTTVRTPHCTFAQLTVSATGNSGAGHIGVVLRFKNTGAQTCKLVGYPGVAGLDARGTQVIQATRTLNGYLGGIPTGQLPPVVTLTTDQSASAIVEGSDVTQANARGCETYPKLLVTPPNTTQSVTINMSMPGCAVVQIHPVVAGTGGSIGPQTPAIVAPT